LSYVKKLQGGGGKLTPPPRANRVKKFFFLQAHFVAPHFVSATTFESLSLNLFFLRGIPRKFWYACKYVTSYHEMICTQLFMCNIGNIYNNLG